MTGQNLLPIIQRPQPPKALRKPITKPFTYNPLTDPALKEWFDRPGIRKLIPQAFETTPHPCPQCKAITPPPALPCATCHRTFHTSCFPPSPLPDDNISVTILHHSELVDQDTVETLKGYLTASNHFTVIDVEDVKNVEHVGHYDAVLYIGDIGTRNKQHKAAQSSSIDKIIRNTKVGVVITAFTPWIKDTYTPFIPLTPPKCTPAMGIGPIEWGEHPIMEGVGEVGAGERVLYCKGRVGRGGRVVVRWANGVPLVTVLESSMDTSVARGRVVNVNMLPVPRLHKGKGWVDIWDPETTDGIRLLTNALRFVAGCSKNEGSFLCGDCKNNPPESKQPPHQKSSDHHHHHLPNFTQIRENHRRKIWTQLHISSNYLSHLPTRPHSVHSCGFSNAILVDKYQRNNGNEVRKGWLPVVEEVVRVYDGKTWRGGKEKKRGGREVGLPKIVGVDKENTLEASQQPESTNRPKRLRPEGAGKGSRQPILSQTTADAPVEISDVADRDEVGGTMERGENGHDEGVDVGKDDRDHQLTPETSGNNVENGMSDTNNDVDMNVRVTASAEVQE